ncbi:MAG: PorT family protein [Bacteroidota bacterium]|nr:PorT family protein [Bacteroidota bacterium]
MLCSSLFAFCFTLSAQQSLDFEFFLGTQSTGMVGTRTSEVNYWGADRYDPSTDADRDYEQYPFFRPAMGFLLNYFPGDYLGFVAGIQYSGHGYKHKSGMSGVPEDRTKELNYLKLPVGLTIGAGEDVRFDCDLYLYPGILLGADDNYMFTEKYGIDPSKRHQTWTFGGGVKLGLTYYIEPQVGIGIYGFGEMDFTDAEDKSASYVPWDVNEDFLYNVYHSARGSQHNYAIGARLALHYRVFQR